MTKVQAQFKLKIVFQGVQSSFGYCLKTFFLRNLSRERLGKAGQNEGLEHPFYDSCNLQHHFWSLSAITESGKLVTKAFIMVPFSVPWLYPETSLLWLSFRSSMSSLVTKSIMVLQVLVPHAGTCDHGLLFPPGSTASLGSVRGLPPTMVILLSLFGPSSLGFFPRSSSCVPPRCVSVPQALFHCRLFC